MLGSSTAHGRRKTELLEISITEILFILIFALLIYTHFSGLEKKIEVSSLDVQIENLKKERDKLHNEKKAFEKKNRNLEKELKKWKVNYAALTTVIKKYISEFGTLTPKEALVKLEIFLDASKKELGGKINLVDDLASLKLENEDLKLENVDLKKKLAELQRLREKESGGGIDKPRCIVSGYPGIIKFLYEITMSPDNYSVKPWWNRSYDPVIFRIPGAEELARGAAMPYSTFTREAKKIVRWNDKQNPRCRFYARIRFKLDGWASVSIFERHKKAITNRFYPKEIIIK